MQTLVRASQAVIVADKEGRSRQRRKRSSRTAFYVYRQRMLRICLFLKIENVPELQKSIVYSRHGWHNRIRSRGVQGSSATPGLSVQQSTSFQLSNVEVAECSTSVVQM